MFRIILIVCAFSSTISNTLYHNNPFLANVIPIGPPHHLHPTEQLIESGTLNTNGVNNLYGVNNVGQLVHPGVLQPNWNLDITNKKYNYSHNPFLASILSSQSSYKPPTQSTVSTTIVQADYPVTQKPVDNTPSGYTYAPQAYDLKKYCLKPRGQFPGKYCNLFVNCWDGFAVEQFCAQPLLFNPISHYCDYSFNVNCQGRPIIAYPTYPAQNSTTTQIPIVIPIHPVNPIPPVKPIPIAPITIAPPPYRPTPPSLPPYFPTTGPITGPPLQDAIPTYNPSLKKYCLKPRGQFPSTSCNKYVNCWDDVVIEQECPQGLLFSPTKCYCDYPYNVVCNKLSLQTVKESSGDPSCLYADAIFSDFADCSSYYVCKNYQIRKLKCFDGYKFNIVIGACDHEHKVDCKKRIEFQSTTNFVKEIPAALIDATLNCEEGKVYPLNSQCTSVSICRKNVAEIVHCPTGFAYDVGSNKCLKAESIKCSWRQ